MALFSPDGSGKSNLVRAMLADPVCPSLFHMHPGTIGCACHFNHCCAKPAQGFELVADHQDRHPPGPVELAHQIRHHRLPLGIQESKMIGLNHCPDSTRKVV
ncbi:MAG: hypothetical protein KFF50_03525 [Desulfatitalea sp.]|nr:hypothetical protein [Desulfatitalea sp.]